MKTKLKQSKLKLAIVSAMLLGTAGLTVPAYADASNTMVVKASINLACTITTTELNFGAYDAIVSHKSDPLNSDGVTIASTCTAGSSGVIKLNDGNNYDSGNRRMVHATNTSKFLNYTVSGVSAGGAKWDNTTGVAYTGDGSEKVLPVYGQVAPDQKTAIDGTYSDMLTALISY
jgi:spore coat protein U-like protein